VVHLTAGISALVLAILIGPRTGFPDDVRPPHAPWMTTAGACMLRVGWFGFNAGSALKAGGDAGHGGDREHLGGGYALVWLTIESVVGIVTGAVAELATITPASGFVGRVGALVIGLAGGTVCYAMVIVVKQRASPSMIRSMCLRCMTSVGPLACCSRRSSSMRRLAVQDLRRGAASRISLQFRSPGS
jgi:ammonium transporter, Amt family